ncbi:unnamed protein product [Musa acuminata var. zebrina]
MLIVSLIRNGSDPNIELVLLWWCPLRDPASSPRPLPPLLNQLPNRTDRQRSVSFHALDCVRHLPLTHEALDRRQSLRHGGLHLVPRGRSGAPPPLAAVCQLSRLLNRDLLGSGALQPGEPAAAPPLAGRGCERELDVRHILAEFPRRRRRCPHMGRQLLQGLRGGQGEASWWRSFVTGC